MSNNWIPTMEEVNDDSFPSPDLLLSTILRNCQKALDKDYDQEYASNLLEGIAYDFVGLYAHMTMGNIPDDWS